MAKVARQQARQRRAAGRSLKVPRHVLGMSMAHFGAGLLVLGVTVSSTMSIAKNVSVTPGQVVRAGSYAFTFHGVHDVKGPNYSAKQALVTASKNGEPAAVLRPEKRIFSHDGTTTTEAAVDAGVFRDLYVAIGKPLGGNAWSLRVQYKPMVHFIWFGGVVMALGGLLALSDRRYRVRRKAEATADDALAGATPPAGRLDTPAPVLAEERR
jgi:cytochrome c-type biogenesis protein CcmF